MRLTFVLSMTSALVVLVGVTTNGCVAEEAASGSDASLPDDTAPALDGAVEGATTDTASSCNTTLPGIGSPCSPTSPCPSSLDCYYEPGCDLPMGKCQVWNHCADTYAEVAFCGCEGGSAGIFGPYAYQGVCRDAEVDAGEVAETRD